MICKRCGLDVDPPKIQQGVFNNVYKCPKCDREFGGPTLFKKGLKVTGWILTIGLIGEAVDEVDLSS
jgi:hypothetical protein